VTAGGQAAPTPGKDAPSSSLHQSSRSNGKMLPQGKVQHPR
jgi:hypothetical protein